MIFISAFNPAHIGMLTGTFLGVLLSVTIIKAIFSKFLPAKICLYASYLASVLLVTLLGAYGLADGHSPQWKASFFSYLPAHLIWFSYDLLKLKLFTSTEFPKVFSKEAMKRSALFLLIALPGCFLSMLLVYGTGLTVTDSTKAYRAERSQLQSSDFVQIIDEFNKKLPMKIDDETTALKLSLEGDKTFVYHYQISNAFYSSPGVRENMEANGIAGMVEYFCFDGAPDLKKKGITAINRYADEKGNFLMQTVLNTEKCTQEYLNLITREIQGQLPIQQDEVTKLIKLNVIGDRDLAYTFTVPSEFYNSPGVRENIAENIPQNMKQNFCFGEGQDFQKINAKIIYRYQDEGGNLLTEYTLDTSDC